MAAKLVAMGEVLIDFTPCGAGPNGFPRYEQNPGGAPANVAVGFRRLGGEAAFVGRVGDDGFGRFLRDRLAAEELDLSGLRLDPRRPTSLAFVHLDASGDRSFSFFRDGAADTALSLSGLPSRLFREATVFHFGSVSLTHAASRKASLAAASRAQAAGALVAYDPNWRPALWPNQEQAKEAMLAGLGLAHLVKLSAEELAFLSGSEDLEEGSRLIHGRGPGLVVVTLGADGAFFRLGEATGRVPAFVVPCVDATGAGDAFWAALLYQLASLAEADPGTPLAVADDLSCHPLILATALPPALPQLLRFANAAAALCVGQHGAIPALPTRQAVERLLATAF